MPDRPPDAEERAARALRGLRALYGEVDREAGALHDRHRARLACRRGCSACCMDGLTVFEVEAENIRRSAPEVLSEAAGPAGGCAFLDGEGACRIYEHRPYVCRTQGLPLLWFDEDDEGEIVEHRDICELNVEGTPLGELPMDDLWTIGPAELRLAKLQEELSGGALRRVPLRRLFRLRETD